MPPGPQRIGFIKIPLGLRVASPSRRAGESSSQCACCIQTEDVDLSVPGLKAFKVRPNANAPKLEGRGLVLLSDVHGYADTQTRSVAERVASTGIPTVVPDLFRGNPWKAEWNKSEYETWRSSIDSDWVNDAIRAAMRELVNSCGVQKIGLLGFCFGGGRVLEDISKPHEGVAPSAAVAFYPTRFDAFHIGKNAKCPVMIVTGDKDDLVPMELMEQLQASLDDNTEIDDWEIRVYEGAGHAFAHKPKSEQDSVDSYISLNDAIQWLHKYI